MKKLLNILFVLVLMLGVFFSAIPVSYADPDGESSTHESSSGNTAGGHGGTFGESEEGSAASEFYNDTSNIGENFCSEPAVKRITKFLGFFILLLKFAVPIIIIVKGMFLFYNAMVKGGSDDLTKNAKELLMKIVLGLLVFFIPSILRGILDLYNDFASVRSEYTDCANCLLDPTGSCD